MQQPPNNQPPPYGNQPSGNQPQYGGQPPANQPPPYGAPPQYGNQQQYAQSQYGGPPLGAQPQEDNDKLIGALSYVFWILVGIIILVTDMKNKPILKFHAYQSITLGLVLMVLWIIASALSIVIIGFCLMPVLFLIPFYPAYLAYSKGPFRLPMITDLTYNIFKDCPRVV